MINVMNAEDRAEVRQMLTDIIAGPLNEVRGELKLANSKLGSIDNQTKITNGRVNKLEERVHDLENADPEPPTLHTVADCAQATVIQDLRDNMISTKAIKKAIVQTLASSAAIVAVLYTIYKVVFDYILIHSAK